MITKNVLRAKLSMFIEFAVVNMSILWSIKIYLFNPGSENFQEIKLRGSISKWKIFETYKCFVWSSEILNLRCLQRNTNKKTITWVCSVFPHRWAAMRKTKFNTIYHCCRIKIKIFNMPSSRNDKNTVFFLLSSSIFLSSYQKTRNCATRKSLPGNKYQNDEDCIRATCIYNTTSFSIIFFCRRQSAIEWQKHRQRKYRGKCVHILKIRRTTYVCAWIWSNIIYSIRMSNRF